MYDRNGKLIREGEVAYMGIRKVYLVPDAVYLDFQHPDAIKRNHPVYVFTGVLPNGKFVRATSKHIRMINENKS